MKHGLQRLLPQLRKGFEAVYGSRLVGMFLYGSWARDDHEPGSDVDVLVVLSGEVNPGEEIARTGSLVALLSLQNNKVVSCLFLSEERLRTERSPLLLNVRKEGLVI